MPDKAKGASSQRGKKIGRCRWEEQGTTAEKEKVKGRRKQVVPNEGKGSREEFNPGRDCHEFNPKSSLGLGPPSDQDFPQCAGLGGGQSVKWPCLGAIEWNDRRTQ